MIVNPIFDIFSVMKKVLKGTGKYIILLGIFLLIMEISMGLVMTVESSEAMKDLIRNRMLDISNTAASMIDGDTLRDIQAEDLNTPEYQEILKTLTYYQDNINLKYIYCIRDIGDKNFVFTIDPTVVDPGEFGEPIVYTDALYKASRGTAAVDKDPYVDKWGRFYSSYSPVFDSNHDVAGIVAVDFSADWYDRQVSNQIMTMMLVTVTSIVFGAIIILLLASYFRKRFKLLYKELNKLTEGVETLSKELSNDNILDGDEVIETELSEEDGMLDDIGVIEKRISLLKEYMSAQIRFVRSKTYIDGLTGVKNRTAYLECVEKIEKRINSGDAEFAVVMFDLNGLKRINDDLGHEKGDMTIKKAAGVIKETFADEQVFRIGGDEFVVLLMDSPDKIDELMSCFEKNCADANDKDDGIPFVISKGYAVFDASTDNNYQYTFERADHAMYKDKKAYYSNIKHK